MLLGFSGRYSHKPLDAPFTAPRFCVKGHEQRVSAKIDGGYLDASAMLSARSRPTASITNFMCGYISHRNRVITLLADHGVELPANTNDADCVRLMYETYGPDGFKFLDGLFVGAFVSKQKLILVSGKTPGPTLYYNVHTSSDEVLFTTEIKALPPAQRILLSFDEVQRAGNGHRLRSTCIQGLLRVPAGHCVEISLRDDTFVGVETEYYSVQHSFELYHEEDAATQIRRTITDAVDSFHGDSANCLISGGLDSSIVAALAARRFESLRLFSLGTHNNNEFDKADLFARSIGMKFDRIIIEKDEFLSALPQVINLTEHSYSTFIEYLVPVHLAHLRVGDSADVLLSGYGSDVLFAGFASAENTLREIAQLVRTEYASTIWSNEASQTLGGVLGAHVAYPFYGSDVVDVAFKIDPFLKFKNGVEKYILRRAFVGQLNDEVLWRRKVGIHQGTGCEAYFTRLVGEPIGTAAARLMKDRLCYAILERMMNEGIAPEDIDVLSLVREVSRTEDRHRLPQAT